MILYYKLNAEENAFRLEPVFEDVYKGISMVNIEASSSAAGNSTSRYLGLIKQFKPFPCNDFP